MRAFSCICMIALSLRCTAPATETVQAIEIPEDAQFNHKTIIQNPSDNYLEAYIQGVLDTKYPHSKVTVAVRNGEILLHKLPENKQQARSIVAFVEAVTDRSVKEEKPVISLTSKKNTQKEWYGIWLPQSTILFPTQIANPRQICFSLGTRFHDKISGSIASEITLGDQFPIYRWANMWGGDLQLELEGGVFGIFNLHDHDFPLVNTDYYVGVPLTFAKGPWAFRVRAYHISSHVGDEYLLKHRHLHRKNKSFEAIDFSADYSFSNNLRFYGVLGSILFSDKEMPMKHAYLEYGFEARGPRTEFTQLFGQPFLAVHLRNWQSVHFATDVTYALGYEWGKLNGIGRKIRVFCEYHQGFSPDGQFSRERTKFLSLRVAYGF